MTTEEEAHYIQQVLPRMVKQPHGFDISEFGGKGPTKPVTGSLEFVSLAKRLVSEGLATEEDPRYGFYLAVTTKGKQIAERPDGYLGYLQQEEKRLRTEESRAKKNVAGTFGSFIVAGLALGFALYTYFATNQDTSALEKKVQVLERRIQSLEQHR
ncbi:MAG: hypothetical protein EOO60_02375 [Hymenobacter sp.]|nr:MAG: hypothetical protein EOO60_02375 [Hymenobacter sp.]